MAACSSWSRVDRASGVPPSLWALPIASIGHGLHLDPMSAVVTALPSQSYIALSEVPSSPRPIPTDAETKLAQIVNGED